MQTNLTDHYKNSHAGNVAEEILGKCVHCGFCTATCPTYQLLGDELDGPRGRIYLIKQVLEGQPATEKTLSHLDRCLTCRSCESTCPSGVEYGKLVEIGRHIVEDQVARPLMQQLERAALKTVLPRNWLFTPLLRTGQALRPLLPKHLAAKVPKFQAQTARPNGQHARKMIVLEGCVQPSISPNINAATARVFDRLKIQLIAAPKAGCCGAIRSHLNDLEGGMADAKRNIDAWIPLLDAGAEAIIMTASGCGTTVKEYGYLLSQDAHYAEKAKRISSVTMDLSEVLASQIEALKTLPTQSTTQQTIAYHPPCSLQHGQKIHGKTEQVLAAVGIPVKRCTDSHICCGSAGTYSILQADIGRSLRDQKLQHLHATGATSIVTANIGCIGHLQSGTDTPVQHWIELLDSALA